MCSFHMKLRKTEILYTVNAACNPGLEVQCCNKLHCFSQQLFWGHMWWLLFPLPVAVSVRMSPLYREPLQGDSERLHPGYSGNKPTKLRWLYTQFKTTFVILIHHSPKRVCVCLSLFQRTTYVWVQPLQCTGGVSLPDQKVSACVTLDFWLKFGVTTGTIAALLLISLSCYFWKKTRKWDSMSGSRQVFIFSWLLLWKMFP